MTGRALFAKTRSLSERTKEIARIRIACGSAKEEQLFARSRGIKVEQCTGSL